MTSKNKGKTPSPDIEEVMMINVRQTFARMETLLDQLGEGADIDKDSAAEHIINDVLSIEAEWILDESLRQELTLIEWED